MEKLFYELSLFHFFYMFKPAIHVFGYIIIGTGAVNTLNWFIFYRIFGWYTHTLSLKKYPTRGRKKYTSLFLIEEHADGSKTVWCNEVERMSRLKGMHGITLYPDKAYIEIRATVYNRTPFPQTLMTVNHTII